MLDRLPVAEGASFDSLADQQDPICLADTRREIITKIEEWVADPSAKSIFWLNGMAGTGKSTISRTVADKFARTGQLSASFFFKRTYRDRAGLSRFFTTLGADLAVREPATASYIKAALDADPALIRKTAREQVDKLFFEPLIKTSKIRGDRPALIIIDALDECAPDDDIRLLVHLLSRVRVSHIPLRVKILITSRPDLHPRLAFQKIHGAYEDVILEKATESTVERDILIFLRQEMTNIRHDYNLTVTKDRQLADDWPAQEDIKYLSWIATPLFIVASTMCLFVGNRIFGSPDERLRDIIMFQTQRHKSSPDHLAKLEMTYVPVLEQLLSGLHQDQRRRALQNFKLIIGTLVFLASPLSTNALAQILDIPKSRIDTQLDFLHSVLRVPSDPDLPVTLLHLSFRDFLVNTESSDSNPFWMDENETQYQIAIHCMNLMNKLKQDICGIEHPDTLRSEISSQTISEHLHPSMQYACIFWVYHLQQATKEVINSHEVYQFLKEHLLHWIEALSLMGKVAESLDIIRSLRSLFLVR